MANALSKMLLLPPATYERLRNEILFDSRMSNFDQKMADILKNKKLSDSDKWILYKRELLRKSNVKRNQKSDTDSYLWPAPQKNKNNNYTYETKGTQTLFKANKKAEGFTQTSPRPIKDVSTQATAHDIFESHGELSTSEEEAEEAEEAVASRPQRRASTGMAAKALRQKRKTTEETLADRSYEVFELNDGTVQTVDAEDIEDFLLNNVGNVFRTISKKKNTPKKTPVKSNYKLRSTKGQQKLNFPAVKNLFRKQSGSGQKVFKWSKFQE